MSSDTPANRPSNARALADLPEPQAILFDLDGTLVDTVHLRIEAWREVLARIGVTVDPESLAGYIGSDGRRLAREVAREAGRDLDYAATDEADRLSGSIFDELNSSPDPLPGATELLTALEESHLTFAIATSSLPGQVSASVRALRLPAPPPITDGSHVAHAKPEPDLLLASAAQLGVAPERCWYVGDSTWDMMASVRAKMIAFGVTTGAVDADELVAAGAAVAVGSLTQLLDELRVRGLVR
ncbi:MAG: HAD family phosphatase [Candidatus Limnocylindrales bacterium]|jgi:beta-phosphoglucomutase-like phosphatase (HAD superfamily)